MNSCLYRALVMHHRLEPKDFRFHYNLFMFYIDLDELDMLAKKFWFIGWNKFNVFNFRDRDHLRLLKENPDKTKTTKQHIIDYLRLNGVEVKNPKIMLLTNLCTFGYQFNPVSFYFISEQGSLPSPAGEGLGVRCCIVEISNTFHEMKPYFIGKENWNGKKFHLNATKYFYVSPFIDHDANFDFNIELPEDKMNIRIDDYLSPTLSEEGEGKRIFISTLTGNRRELTNMRLLWYAIRFPFITLQVIGLIHWNAFRLWLKKIPHRKKKEMPELQREVYKPYN